MKEWWRKTYQQLIHPHDTPHQKAAGLGTGVFFGIFPGTGPVAAVLVATLLKYNKVLAFLGGILTNTWVNVVLFVPALKIGAFISGREWSEVYEKGKALVENFSFQELFDTGFMQIAIPVAIGFVTIGFVFAVFIYGITLGFILLTGLIRNHKRQI